MIFNNIRPLTAAFIVFLRTDRSAVVIVRGYAKSLPSGNPRQVTPPSRVTNLNTVSPLGSVLIAGAVPPGGPTPPPPGGTMPPDEPPPPWYQRNGAVLGVIAALLLIALVVILILWLGGGDDDDETSATTTAVTTIVAGTLPPSTTVAPTTVPATTVAPTTVAPTTVPPTTVAPTTVPPTTVPPVVPDDATAFGILQANPDQFSTLVALIERVGLDDALSEPGQSFTIFAPTNDALDEIDVSGLNDEQVTDVLLHHVVPESLDSTAVFESSRDLDTLNELFEVLATAGVDDTRPSSERLLAVLRALRQYGLAHPNLYQLAMTSSPGDGRPEEEVLVQMVLPLQALMADVVGEANSLSALRGAVALAHGFVMLEINQQLQRGGDLEAAFVASAEAYLRGWQAS